MRNRLLLASIVLVFAAVTMTAPINAVLPERPDTDGSPYVVEKGDTLWDKAGGPGWERGWAALVEENPWLADRRTDYSADKIRVEWYPGELVYGLEASGLEIRNEETESATEYDPHAAALAPATMSATVPLTQDEPDGFNPPWWWWPLLIILGIAFLVWLWRFTHPTTAGEPILIVPLRSTNPGRVANHAERLGEERFGPLATAEAPERPRRVGDVERGFVSGVGRVQYMTRKPLRSMHREPGFRATFRFPDGHTEQLVFLQECGNDVTYGGIRYLGFTFEPVGGIGVVAPEPAPAPPPPQTWGLERYRRYRSRLQMERVPLTRARLWGHIIDLEEMGWEITAFRELLDKREELEEEARRIEGIRAEQRRKAEALRRQAAELDTAVEELGHGVERVRERNRGLQPDLDLLRPRPVAETPAVAAANDGTETTPEAMS